MRDPNEELDGEVERWLVIVIYGIGGTIFVSAGIITWVVARVWGWL